MTDTDRQARRAQLAVLLDRADRLTVDEAALLRTLIVAELATTFAQSADGISGRHESGATQDALRTEVRAALTVAGISQASAARQLGLSQKHVSQMLTGRATLTIGWADRILALCGLRLHVSTIQSDAPAGDPMTQPQTEADLPAPAAAAPTQPDITPQAGQPQADGPLVLDRAAADALRERYAAAMLEHYITDEADVDGHRFCSCTEWGEGPDEHWDYHLADVFLAVRDDEVARLRRDCQLYDRYEEQLQQQIADAEATIAQVRELAGRWVKRTDQLKRGAELLTSALNGPAGW